MNVYNLLNDLYKKRLHEENVLRLYVREGNTHMGAIQHGIISGLRMAEASVVERASPDEIYKEDG